MSERKHPYDVIKDETYGWHRLDPIPTKEKVEKFYEQTYYKLIQEGKRGVDLARRLKGGDEAQAQANWLAETLYTDIAWVLDQYAPGKKVMEVGCGFGDLLLHLKKHNFDVCGVEPAKQAAEICRDLGLDIIEHVFEDMPATDPVDAVIFCNILEQTTNPQKVIDAAYQRLAPGGLVIVRSGNDFNPLQSAAVDKCGIKRWWVTPPDHIHYLNYDAVGKVFEKAGFTEIYRQSDFPMEMFLLMGDNYVGNPDLGKQCHAKRVAFERSLEPDVRRALYQGFASAGIGRCLFMVGRK